VRRFASALLAFAIIAQAQELTPADMTLMGMQLGKTTLQEILSRFGVAPLRHGDVDELCYRSESPLESTWVLFGAGERGDWETLTQFRVLSAPPADITCPPTPLLTPATRTDGGIRIGMPGADIKPRLGPRLQATIDNGRVTSYIVRLAD
jgi:hypothetical protein